MNHKRTENLEAEATLIRHTSKSRVVVPPREEVRYALRHVEFDMLCEGDQASIAVRMREFSIHSIHMSMGALFALVALIIGINGDFAKASRNWVVFAFAVLLLSIFLAGLAIAWIANGIAARHKTDSAYSRLKKEIEDWFKRQGQR